MSDMFSTPTKSSKAVLNIPPSPFLKRLGYGTGVGVYQFERSPVANKVQSPWALKIIKKVGSKNTSYGARLREEANLLKKLNHPNIVGFRAFTKTNLGDECLAMEVCTISLGDLIEKRNEEGLLAFPPAKIMKMSHNISKALDYLHVRMLLLHGDIKSYNVLIVNDFEVCKLCDFGVSLPLTRNGDLDKEKAGENAKYIGTECWSAPEVLQDTPNITNKADIFSFGLVIWEMMALTIPHSLDLENLGMDESCSLEDSFKDSSMEFGTRPKIPAHMLGENEEIYAHPLEIFYCCTEEKPERRPTAYHLVLTCTEMIEESKNKSKS